MYYLYLWLQDKPDLAHILLFCCPSPTGSIMTRQTLAESVNTLAAACMPNPSQVKLTKEKVKAAVGKNCDGVLKRLLKTKRQSQSETDNGVQKFSRKYKKKLTEELNFSSNSDSDSSVSINL